MDITSAISTISQSIEIIRFLKDIEKDYSNAEFKLKFAELYSNLAEVKVALSDAQTKISEQERIIEQISSKNVQKLMTVEYRGYSFGIDKSGNSIGRPFCNVCLNQDGLQMQLVRMDSTIDMCPRCKAVYSGHPYKLPENYENLQKE